MLPISQRPAPTEVVVPKAVVFRQQMEQREQVRAEGYRFESLHGLHKRTRALTNEQVTKAQDIFVGAFASRGREYLGTFGLFWTLVPTASINRVLLMYAAYYCIATAFGSEWRCSI